MLFFMALHALTCPHCAGDNLAKHGKTAAGSPRYRCNACKRAFYFDPKTPASQDPAFRELLVSAHQERMSLRGIARAFHVGRQTVADLIKRGPSRSSKTATTP
jgi:transposase-like protein